MGYCFVLLWFGTDRYYLWIVLSYRPLRVHRSNLTIFSEALKYLKNISGMDSIRDITAKNKSRSKRMYNVLRVLWAYRCVVTWLQWRHNERDGVSNLQPLDCLFNRLFRRTSKKTSSSASLAFVWEFTGHKWPIARKFFPYDDVIMW